MDQIKIGKFIAERRKNKNMTQAQLAEKVGVTDRAVSKWENGRSMPDSSIMLELCGVLSITVNDLLYGEVVTVNNYNEKMENILLEAIKEKQQADKRLLRLEIVIGIFSIIFLLACTFTAAFVNMPDWTRIVLIVVGFVLCLIGVAFGIHIEQTAGYYECAKCGHRYVPKYGSVLMAMHFGRTRYMKCPECGKFSWQKKRIGKEQDS